MSRSSVIQGKNETHTTTTIQASSAVWKCHLCSLSLSLSFPIFPGRDDAGFPQHPHTSPLHPCRKMPFSINASFTLLFEAGFPERFLSSAILQKCSSFTPVNSTTLELSGSTPCLLGILTFGVFLFLFFVFFYPFWKAGLVLKINKQKPGNVCLILSNGTQLGNGLPWRFQLIYADDHRDGDDCHVSRKKIRTIMLRQFYH